MVPVILDLGPNTMDEWFSTEKIFNVDSFGTIRLAHKSDGSSTSYYKIPPNCTDLIDLIEYKNMNFAIGNIFKACYRLGQKEGNDDSYDLRKIIFFAERELKRIEKSTNPTR